MNTSKGQGLSISTIVIAAIALLVLVVLAVLVLRAGQDTGKGVTSCPGTCEYASCSTPDGVWTKSLTGKCSNDNDCCIRLTKPSTTPTADPAIEASVSDPTRTA